MHLILDGYSRDSFKTAQLEVKVSEVVDFLNVTPVAPLSIYEASDGVTLLQIIAESHICIHTVNDFIHIDIFSCRDFPMPDTSDFLIEKFALTQIVRNQILTRGFGG